MNDCDRHIDSIYWFDYLDVQNKNQGDVYQIEYGATNVNTKEDWQTWKECPTLIYQHEDTCIPYPSIIDNTEGIGGVYDLNFDGASIVANMGAGKFDDVKMWLESKYPSLCVYSLDPYHRSKDHNRKAQDEIVKQGGADITLSISVLNILESKVSRHRHISIVYESLRKGGRAYFKIWAGMWPYRGLGKASYDDARHVLQLNRWASDYLEEIEQVFGSGNLVADNNTNFILAVKREQEKKASSSSGVIDDVK